MCDTKMFLQDYSGLKLLSSISTIIALNIVKEYILWLVLYGVM